MSTTPPPGQPEPQQPGTAPPPPAATPPPAAAQPPATTGAGGRVVELGLNAPLEVTNWRPLVAGLLAFPHFVVAGIMNYVANLWGFFIVLFTAEMPKNAGDFIAMSLRENWRTYSYAFFMREDYPPFEFDTVAQDPGGDQATLSVNYTPGPRERFGPIIKWFVGIPHFIYGFGRAIMVYITVIIAFFTVLTTGAWPAERRQYVIDTMRWWSEVTAWLYGLTDEKPPLELR